MKWYKGNPDLFVISQAAKQKLGHEVAEYETKEKQTSKKFEIIDELHAGDVIYEKLTLRLGCVRLKVLTEPIRVELDEKTTCWDFTAELLEKRLYKWNKDNSNKELISVESFDDEDRYRNFRLCEQVANGRPQLYKNNPFELGQDETDYLIWPPFNIVK